MMEDLLLLNIIESRDFDAGVKENASDDPDTLLSLDLIELLRQEAVNFQKVGKLDAAISSYDEALALAEDIEMQDYKQIPLFFLIIKRKAAILNSNQQAVTLEKDTARLSEYYMSQCALNADYIKWYIIVLISRAEIFYNFKHFDNSLSLYNTALEWNAKLSDNVYHRFRSRIFSGKYYNLLGLNRYKEAMIMADFVVEYYRKSLPEDPYYFYFFGLKKVLTTKASVQKQLGDYKGAEVTLSSLVSICWNLVEIELSSQGKENLDEYRFELGRRIEDRVRIRDLMKDANKGVGDLSLLNRLKELRDNLLNREERKDLIEKAMYSSEHSSDEFDKLISEIIVSVYEVGEAAKNAQKKVEKKSIITVDTQPATRQTQINADQRAMELAPLIDNIKGQGIHTLQGIADALSESGVFSKSGKAWTPMGIKLLQERIEHVRKKGKRSLEVDSNTQRLMPLIDEIKASGIDTLKGIADALNEKGELTVNENQWTPGAVKVLLQRVDRYRSIDNRLIAR